MFIKEVVVNASRKLMPEKELIKWENNFLVQFLFLTTVQFALLSSRTISIVGSLRKTPSSFLSRSEKKLTRRRSRSYSIWTKHWSTLGEAPALITPTTWPLRYSFQDLVQRINNVHWTSSFSQALSQDCCWNLHSLCLYRRVEKICGRRS